MNADSTEYAAAASDALKALTQAMEHFTVAVRAGLSSTEVVAWLRASSIARTHEKEPWRRQGKRRGRRGA